MRRTIFITGVHNNCTKVETSELHMSFMFYILPHTQNLLMTSEVNKYEKNI